VFSYAYGLRSRGAVHCGGTAVLIEKSRDVGLFSAKVTVYFPTGMVIFVEVQSTQNNSLISMVAGSKVFSFFCGPNCYSRPKYSISYAFKIAKCKSNNFVL